ncbi:MAG: hypothetical protein HY210_06335 [Candidatus Omnitrophica bacterium]|nr:hypothetical protein [Candidatus Omnitrophota bacterium]
MTKQEVDLGVEVIKYTFDKLPIPDRIRVVEELERETRRQRWDQVVSRVRSRAAKNPISQKEINRICEEVRQRNYEKRIKSGR